METAIQLKAEPLGRGQIVALLCGDGIVHSGDFGLGAEQPAQR